MSADEYDDDSRNHSFVGTASTSDSVGIVIYDGGYVDYVGGLDGLKELGIKYSDENYVIYIYDAASKKYVKCKNCEEVNTGKSSIWYWVKGLKKNTTYYFKVGLKGEDGKVKAKSNKFKVKTKPAAYPSLKDISADFELWSSFGYYGKYNGTNNVCAAVLYYDSYPDRVLTESDISKKSKEYEKALKKKGYTLKEKKTETLTETRSDGSEEKITRTTYDLIYKGKKVGVCIKETSYIDSGWSAGWSLVYRLI
ncbi:MAG: hypothetical protein K6C13_13995 [Oscillospiraceae bacterium]|nr:hypothetical protein [Oscillospiraceae bacterium]